MSEDREAETMRLSRELEEHKATSVEIEKEMQAMLNEANAEVEALRKQLLEAQSARDSFPNENVGCTCARAERARRRCTTDRGAPDVPE